ncbi:MAG: HAD family hydrolase [Bacteroidota bacterium]
MSNLIVFDLDDTLYKEIDFLKSAYLAISNILDLDNEILYDYMIKCYFEKKDVFELLSKKYLITKSELLGIYRNHKPVTLPTEINIKRVLNSFKKKGNFLGLITDGRSLTQRNKLVSLEIEKLFDLIIISDEFGSEKPCEKNYLMFERFEVDRRFYIGDNPNKDFLTPNKLGWTTICLLDNGKNIHKQNFSLPSEYLPHIKIKNLFELDQIL